MPIRNNPTLGHTICSECGELASVHQQARGSGRFLYTRGCDCKFRNSTGRIFQTRLWDETDWLPEADPEMPFNVEIDTEPCHPERIEQTGRTAAELPCADGDESEIASPDEERLSGWVMAGLSVVAGITLFVLTGGRRLR